LKDLRLSRFTVSRPSSFIPQLSPLDARRSHRPTWIAQPLRITHHSWSFARGLCGSHRQSACTLVLAYVVSPGLSPRGLFHSLRHAITTQDFQHVPSLNSPSGPLPCGPIPSEGLVPSEDGSCQNCLIFRRLPPTRAGECIRLTTA